MVFFLCKIFVFFYVHFLTSSIYKSLNQFATTIIYYLVDIWFTFYAMFPIFFAASRKKGLEPCVPCQTKIIDVCLSVNGVQSVVFCSVPYRSLARFLISNPVFLLVENTFMILKKNKKMNCICLHISLPNFHRMCV